MECLPPSLPPLLPGAPSLPALLPGAPSLPRAASRRSLTPGAPSLSLPPAAGPSLPRLPACLPPGAAPSLLPQIKQIKKNLYNSNFSQLNDYKIWKIAPLPHVPTKSRWLIKIFISSIYDRLKIGIYFHLFTSGFIYDWIRMEWNSTHLDIRNVIRLGAIQFTWLYVSYTYKWNSAHYYGFDFHSFRVLDTNGIPHIILRP